MTRPKRDLDPRLRSDFVPTPFQNDVDPRSFPLGNGVDGTKSAGTKSKSWNEVSGTKSHTDRSSLTAAALQERSHA